MSFSADIAAFADKAGQSLDWTVRSVTLELFTSVIEDTPVDTGRARGNWQTNVGSYPDNEVDRSEQSAMGELYSNVGGYGKITYMVNNLPYIGKLEYGYSRQAPAGMVRKNFTRVEAIVANAVSKNKV